MSLRGNMNIRKRIAGGGLDSKGQRKASYLIIPRLWLQQIEIATGVVPEYIDLEVQPLSIIMRPVMNGEREEVTDDKTVEE